MSKKAKISLAVTASVLLVMIITIGIWLFVIWGNGHMNSKEVSYDKIDNRLNDVYVVDLPIDENEVSFRISFPSYFGSHLEENNKTFYPDALHDYLTTPMSTNLNTSKTSFLFSPLIAGLPPTPYTFFDYNPFGHNEFANGYDIETKDFKAKNKFSVKARKDMSHMESRGFASHYFIVKHYEFENVYTQNNQRITYLYLDDTLHVSFMKGEYSFYVYFEYADAELIKSDFDVMFASI